MVYFAPELSFVRRKKMRQRAFIVLVLLCVCVLSVRFKSVVLYTDPASDLVALYKYGEIDKKYQSSDYQVLLLELSERDDCGLRYFYNPEQTQFDDGFDDIGSYRFYKEEPNEQPMRFRLWAFVVQNKNLTKAEARVSLLPKLKTVLSSEPDVHCEDVAEG